MNMENKDKIKEVFKVLSDKLKEPDNKELLDELLIQLSPLLSTGEQRLDAIYELCLEKIVKEQAKAFYKDFPIEELRPQLVDDFIRMERARRRDDFDEFCLNVYKQIENIVGYYFSNEVFLKDVGTHIEEIAYETDKVKKQHADIFIIDQGHRAALNLKDLYWNEKFNCVLYWNCFHKKWNDEYESMKRKGSQLQQCRNKVHPGSTPTEYQKNILDEVLPYKYQYYLKFTSLLSVFVERITESFTIGIIKTKLPGMAIATINGKDYDLDYSIISKFEKGDSILVRSYTTKNGKRIIKEAEKV